MNMGIRLIGPGLRLMGRVLVVGFRFGSNHERERTRERKEAGARAARPRGGCLVGRHTRRERGIESERRRR